MTIDDDGWVPVAGVGAPEERRDLDDLDLMAEATHPIRGMILRRLKEPRTVADVAELLDVPITRLYHHVNRLVDAGLIHVVATRQVAAVTERRYQTVARSFGVGADLLNSTDKRELSAALGSLFDVAKLGFQRFVESEAFTVADDEGDDDTALSLSEIHLTEPRRRELMRRLRELHEEFRSDATDDDPDASHLTLFVAVNPEAT
ncbi:MAG: helix-turn-helix domain-containing protein [Ilumatobacteraceae bacterium]|nr:helix-turn-helix domain-containing protein [Ilumatobacteraceae bacterium]